MGFDHPTLHLILTVGMTATATSLALICHLFKLDNQRLNAELHRRNEQGPALSLSKAPGKIGTEPSCDSVLNAVPLVRENIREYVKRRSQDWNGVADARKAATRTPQNFIDGPKVGSAGGPGREALSV
jgi:hypothetical protein